MQKTNAEDESLIREAEAIANRPTMEADTSVETGSLISGSSEASNAGVAVAPATPALALAK